MKLFEPQFRITNAVARDLTVIERARGFFAAATLSEDWIAQMSERAILLEAHHTTRIEGTELTLDQSKILLGGGDVEKASPDDVRELLNYRDAFELVSEYLESGAPVTEVLIREIHRKLVDGVRGNEGRPGEYRRVQNAVVNNQTGQVIYMPPPAPEVAGLMNQLIQWINEETEIHPVLIAALAQFQLVHIHPFVDGNGRTSRLLSTLCLYRTGYDFKRLFTISEFYDRDRRAFYDAIQSVRDKDMDYTGWLEFFTDGLATQMQETVDRGTLAIKIDVLTKEHGLNQRHVQMLHRLLDCENLTIQDFEGVFPDVTRRTLQRDLKRLEEIGMVERCGETNQLRYRAQPLR